MPTTDKVLTLAELAEYLMPQTYASLMQAKAQLADVPPAPPRQTTERAFEYIENNSRHPGYESRWQRWGLEEDRDFLCTEIQDDIRIEIGSPRCTTTGIGPMGTPVEIPRELAPQLVIGLDSNTLATHGGMMWSGIMVVVRQAGESAAEATAPGDMAPRPRGRPGILQAQVVTWLQNHPDAPRDSTVPALSAAMLPDKVFASDKTIREALKKVRQKPAK